MPPSLVYISSGAVHCAEEGWSEELIRTYTGHEDFRAMRPYFAIGDKKRQMYMEKHF